MTSSRVPLCRWCGVRVYWNVPQKVWMHRRAGVHCRPYEPNVAEPTVFREAGGEH